MKCISYTTVWITGASDGIGKSLALLFVRMGKSIVLSGRNKVKTDLVAELCRKEQINQDAYIETEIFDCNDLIASDLISRRLSSKIDLAIFCAGLSQRAMSSNLDVQSEIQINNVNFVSPIICSKNLIQAWKGESAKKKILFVSSIASHLPIPLRAMYGASKASLEHYCNTVQNELRKENINGIELCVIIPGFVNTGISQKALIGNGYTWDIQDNNQNKGLSCKKAAIKIVNVINTRKKKLYIGMKLELYIIVCLYKAFPLVANKILAKVNTT